MKAIASDRQWSNPIRSQATPASLSSPESGDAGTVRLVVDDNRMFRESEVQVRCHLRRVAISGRSFTFDKPMRKVRALLARVVSLQAGKY
jgi:hypothetical protein